MAAYFGADRHFRFRNGEKGEKILIAWGPLTALLSSSTTSEGNRYRNDYRLSG